jgi:serine/threonine-protein kinase
MKQRRSVAGARIRARLLFLCLLAAGALSSWRAHAQTSATDKATAEALFDRGLSLMHQGSFKEACELLEQSQATEQAIGTMLYLAECYERLGRTASAWALFREASSRAQAAGHTERAEAGKRRADVLERTLSRLTVDVPRESAIEGLEVSCNGTPVALRAWGLALPVDPGPQYIEARAPRREAWSQRVQVESGASARVSVPLLALAPRAEPVALKGAQATEPAEPSVLSSGALKTDSAGVGHRFSAQQISGLALGAGGVVALALGGGFGIKAILKNNEAKDECPGDKCTPHGRQLTEQANDAARVSNATFITGGVLLVAAAVVYFTAPKPRRISARPTLAPGLAGLSVGGAF